MRLRTNLRWSKIVVQAWLQSVDTYRTLRFDNFDLRYRPGMSVSSANNDTECNPSLVCGAGEVGPACIVPTATPTRTPTRTPTPSPTHIPSFLAPCQLQYLIHTSVGESTSASDAALAGAILMQLNHFAENGTFYGFKVVMDYLNEVFRGQAGYPIPDDQQRQVTYGRYILECQSGRLPVPYSNGTAGKYPLARSMAEVMTQVWGDPLRYLDPNSFGISQGDYTTLQLIATTIGMQYDKGISDMRRFLADPVYRTYPQMIPSWGEPVDYSVDPARVIFWPYTNVGQVGAVLIHSGESAGLPQAYYCSQLPSGPPAIRIGLPNDNFCQVCDPGSIVAPINGEFLARSCTLNGRQVGFDASGNRYP